MITVYSAWVDDYSGLGICALTPEECVVKEQAGGAFRLEMTHPMDDTGRWWNLLKYNVIKAPCPVRETPKINAAGAEPGQTVTRKVYSVSVNTRLRLRTKPSTSAGKIIGRYKNGTKVLRIGENGEWYEVVVKSGGATGWMHSDYLKYVGEETTVIPGNDAPPKTIEARETREQLFRIRSVDRDDEAGKVYVTALHISYDMIGWTVKSEYSPKDIPVGTALAELVNRSKVNDEFSFYCTATGNVTGEFRGRGLLSAVLENDGLAIQTHARIIRDNFDFFLLPDEARDRGVQIRHGKNLTGAILSEDVSEAITRVIPVGKTKKGDPLYLDGQIWVECPEAANIPIVAEKEIQYDVKVGDKEFETAAKARAELARFAALEFTENGLHLGITGLEVDFVTLQDTYGESVAQNYAALQAVHLYDLVRVTSGRSGIDAKLRVTGYAYDCLSKRYREVILGELYALDSGVSGFDITGGISGSKVIPGSLDGDRVRDMTINFAKIAQAAIEQLNAEAITAVRAHINELVAGSVTTDQLYADFAKIASLEVAKATIDYANIKELDVGVINALVGKFEEIAAGELVADELYASFAEIINLAAKNLKADSLSAALGNFVSMYAGTGEFDFATIQNLVAKAMALQQGSMDTVYIKNLAVTTANMLSATLGKLVIKGDDGKYYRVFISATGEVKTEEVQPTEDEIQSGQTSGGQQIVETNMNVGNLNATTIQGSSAVINEILTIALNADKITAADALIASATITELYTTSIKAIGDNLDLSANESIKAIVGNTSQIYRSETPPENAPIYAIWVQPSTGYSYQNTDGDGLLPDFFTDRDGNLYYRYEEGKEGIPFELNEAGDLYMSEDAEFGVQINDNGVPTVWKRIKDSDIDNTKDDLENKISGTYSELTQTVDSLEFAVKNKLDRDEAQTYMRYKGGILELGKKGSRYTTQTSESGFVVLQDGEPMTSMKQNTVSAPVMEARRMLTIGGYSVFTGATGHLIFN